MSVPIVQIQYQQLEQLAQRFAKQQTQVQAILQSLKQTIQALEHGGWMGEAATACFKEFYAEVVPAYCRLQHVFSESQTSLNQIAKLFHEAEAEAAALFRGEGGSVEQQSELINDLSQPQQTIHPSIDRFLQWVRTPQQTLIIETIRLIPLEIRQTLLSTPEVLQAIRALPGILPQMIIASLLEGSLTWSAASLVLTDGQFAPTTQDKEPPYQTANRNFAQLINSLIADPAMTNESLNTYAAVALPQYSQWNLNCWESVLYIGLLSGDLSLTELDQIYTNVATQFSQAGDNAEDQKQAANQALADSLGYNPNQTWCEGDPIDAGSIVFFVSGGSPLSHVAMATGRMIDNSPELISLWDRPNGSRSVQFTTIEALNSSNCTISVAPNPWLND
ncbi:WXG100 family type VII secretion target [Herpetosiphon gulosus]|uniref:Peptidase C51 domain-containing protein n=1 Tax=Herpetosiphon gulosus TaxID=1973496 RepID=A0ABP9WUL3_9CHLR